MLNRLNRLHVFELQRWKHVSKSAKVLVPSYTAHTPWQINSIFAVPQSFDDPRTLIAHTKSACLKRAGRCRKENGNPISTTHPHYRKQSRPRRSPGRILHNAGEAAVKNCPLSWRNVSEAKSAHHEMHRQITSSRASLPSRQASLWPRLRNFASATRKSLQLFKWNFIFSSWE